MQTSTTFFKVAGLKNSKMFFRDEPLSFFHRFLNSKFSNRFDFTWTLFPKIHIIFDPNFPYISTKISKLEIYSLVQTAKYLWGTINSFCACLISQSVYAHPITMI